MKKTLIYSMATAILLTTAHSSELLLKDTKRFGGDYGLIVVFDKSGLNSYNSCPSLVEQNLKMYKNLVNKRTIKKMRLDFLEFITFDENINQIAFISENRASKLYKKSKEAMNQVIQELKSDTSTQVAKDVMTTLNYVQTLTNTKYKEYEKLGILIVSNLMDSSHDKQYFKTMSPIKFKDNVSIKILAQSGLSCKKQIGASQILATQKNTKEFFLKKIIAKDLDIQNIY